MMITFGMSSRPSVTVTVKCVWVKNSNSIQSGWSSGARVNLSNEDIQDVRNRQEGENESSLI